MAARLDCLHCNLIDCRAECTDRAVVTTCSHIFCLRCAGESGLSTPRSDERQCPACGTALPKLDDAVIAQLNPGEDYIKSILSGLHPDIIMRCAGQGLSFYTYQVAQEIRWQTHLANKFEKIFTNLQKDMHNKTCVYDNTVRHLESRATGYLDTLRGLQDKCAQLEAALTQKTSEYDRLSEHLKGLKQSEQLNHVAAAAEHRVEEYLHDASRFAVDKRPHQQHQQRPLHQHDRSAKAQISYDTINSVTQSGDTASFRKPHDHHSHGGSRERNMLHDGSHGMLGSRAGTMSGLRQTAGQHNPMTQHSRSVPVRQQLSGSTLYSHNDMNAVPTVHMQQRGSPMTKHGHAVLDGRISGLSRSPSVVTGISAGIRVGRPTIGRQMAGIRCQGQPGGGSGLSYGGR